MFLPGWRSVWRGISDTCTDQRCFTACQKKHRQNEPAGQEDVPIRVEVRVMGDPRHGHGPQMSHRLSKRTQTEWTSWLGRHCYWSGGQHEGGSRTCVGTTDVSPPIKNNTDRMNQLFGLTFLIWWRSVWWGIPDTGRDHRCLTTCQKNHRQNEPHGQVDIPTRVEVCVMGDPGHM